MRQINWISIVGDDPSLGGGVARAVSNIKKLKLFDNRFQYTSFYKVPYHRQLKQIFKLLMAGETNFVIHSVLSAPSIFLLLAPVRIKLIILPHGELNPGALSKKKLKKYLSLYCIRFFHYFLRNSKQVKIIATSKNELDLFANFYKEAEKIIVPDIYSYSDVLSVSERINPDSGQNLILIGRINADKGFSHFLLQLASHFDNRPMLSEISGINIFYIPEDEQELKKIEAAVGVVRSRGVEVNLHNSFSRDQIIESISQLQNRRVVIPSRYESFSYVLIESLGFELCPIVWFDNTLSSKLHKSGLCIISNYGDVSDVLDTSEHFLDKKNVEGFFSKSERFIFDTYIREIVRWF